MFVFAQISFSVFVLLLAYSLVPVFPSFWRAIYFGAAGFLVFASFVTPLLVINYQFSAFDF